jgi:hypothetical protein
LTTIHSRLSIYIHEYTDHHIKALTYSRHLPMITTTTALPIRAHSTRQTAYLLNAVASLSHVRPTGLGLGHAPGLRCGIGAACQAPRAFSTSPVNHLRDIFPAKDTPHIKTTKPAWPHPGYTREEMLAVEPAHRKPRVLSDLLAWKLVRLARFWMDIFTGVKPEQQSDKKQPTTAVGASKPLTEAQWVCSASHPLGTTGHHPIVH